MPQQPFRNRPQYESLFITTEKRNLLYRLDIIFLTLIPISALLYLLPFATNLKLVLISILVAVSFLCLLGPKYWHSVGRDNKIFSYIVCKLILLTIDIGVVALYVSPFASEYLYYVIETILIMYGVVFLWRANLVLSNLRARVRHLRKGIRHDDLHSLFSPTYEYTHIVNRLRYVIRRWIVIYEFYVIVFAALLIGGVGIPLMIIVLDHLPSSTAISSVAPSPTLTAPPATQSSAPPITIQIPQDSNTSTETQKLSQQLISLFSIGSLSAGLFVLISVASWFSLRRERYVMTVFGAFSSDDTKKDLLELVAKQITQRFVEQLEEIGLLLSIRNIESIQTQERFPSSQFITMGSDDNQLLTALQSLVDVDERAKTLVGTFLVGLIKLTAHYSLTGTLRAKDDRSLELEVRLTRRYAGQTIVTVPIDSVYSTADSLDDATITQAARMAALRLIIRTGAINHIASNERSLDDFLDGLKSSTEQNWWRATESYRRAIQVEESIRGSFGIGHYHLGAALIRQGDFEEGMKHLEQAEMTGPALAETQYMLALGKTYRYYAKLHESDEVFKQVEHHCNYAKRSRRIFPEVYHLQGAAAYHRAKLMRREATRRYGEPLAADKKTKLSREARKHYIEAAREFRKAITLYDRVLGRLTRSRTPASKLEGEIERIRRDRMTATHQLGDALRSLGWHAEADTYYEDVLVAYPANIRTMADMAKNYCLSQNWQRADEFLSREALLTPEGVWNADISFHVGWAYLGGILELVQTSDHLLHALNRINSIEGYAKTFAGLLRNHFQFPISSALVSNRPFVIRNKTQPPPSDGVSQWNTNIRNNLGEALQRLDYAFHQRSRYMASWEDTDWEEILWKLEQSKAFTNNIRVTGMNVYTMIEDSPNESSLLITTDLRVTTLDTFFFLMKRWIYLRMKSRDYRFDTPSREENLRWIRYATHNRYPDEDFAGFFEKMLDHKRKIAELHKDIEASGRLHGMAHAERKLRLAALCLNNWKLTYDAFKSRYHAMGSMAVIEEKFSERWAQDVFAEVSLIASRMLAEAWAYETAWIVSSTSAKLLENWLNNLETKGGGKYYFSPFVSRFQLSSLYAWGAFCALKLDIDVQTQGRLKAAEQNTTKIKSTTVHPNSGILDPNILLANLFIAPLLDNKNEEITTYKSPSALLDEARMQIPISIRKSLTQMERHPLALLAQAQFMRQERQLGLAAAELQRLIEALTPFDPNIFIANWRILEKRKPSIDINISDQSESGAAADSVRRDLRRQDFVSGSSQFENVVSEYSVREELSDSYAQLGRLDLSVDHLMRSLTYSPHWDIDADNLLMTLVVRLDRLDRFNDAKAAITALRARRRLLESNTFSITKLLQPDVMECIINSRMGNYRDALLLGQKLRSDLDKKYADFQQIIQERWLDQNTLGLQYSRHIEKFSLKSELSITNLLAIAVDALKEEVLSANSSGDGLAASSLPPSIDMLAKICFSQDQFKKLTLRILNKIEINEIETLQNNAHPNSQEHPIDLPPTIGVKWNLTIRLAYALCMEAIQYVELYAQLHNNLAYNQTELRLMPNENNSYIDTLSLGSPTDNVKESTALIEELLRHAETYQRKRSHNIEQEVLETSSNMVLSDRIAGYRQNLSYYYDTLGWVYYRKAISYRPVENSDEFFKSLDSAEKYLEIALQYDQGSSIIYYHMTRIILSRLERIWQRARFKNYTSNIQDNEAEKLVLSVDNYLVAALDFWSQASYRDQNNRLGTRLPWLRHRIDSYREQWNSDQKLSFRTDDLKRSMLNNTLPTEPS